jgi:hypothetical protein
MGSKEQPMTENEERAQQPALDLDVLLPDVESRWTFEDNHRYELARATLISWAAALADQQREAEAAGDLARRDALRNEARATRRWCNSLPFDPEQFARVGREISPQLRAHHQRQRAKQEQSEDT